MAFIKSFIERLSSKPLQRAWDQAQLLSWPDGIRTYLDAGPPTVQHLRAMPLLALDFETDGLEADHDPILSAGFVPITEGVIEGKNAEHWVVKAAGDRNAKTVAVHGLTDTDISTGVPLPNMVNNLFTALAGRIILAHHAMIEIAFLRQACLDLYGAAPPLLALDTMKIEHQRPGQRSDSLRLLDLRQGYGLPSYQNHHALSDAHACAELFLAQIAHIGDAKALLSRYMCRSL